MDKKKLLKIEVIVKAMTTKDGRSFNTYKGVQKDGKLIDLKFRKEVKAPDCNGYIYCEKEQVNLVKNVKFPVVWVRKIEKFEPKTVEAQQVDIFDEE